MRPEWSYEVTSLALVLALALAVPKTNDRVVAAAATMTAVWGNTFSGGNCTCALCVGQVLRLSWRHVVTDALTGLPKYRAVSQLCSNLAETEIYSITSKEILQRSHSKAFDDGTYWEQLIEGPLRYMRINFNRTVDLRRVTLMLRINPTLRVFTSDANGTLRTKFFYLQAERNVPLQTDITEDLPVTKVLFQGFDAQLTFDEVLLMNVTVCAHDCRAVQGCFGDCIKLVKDFGCTECKCPEGSLSIGCSGISKKDMRNLFDPEKELKPECKLAVGFRRMIDEKYHIDRCVPFTYLRCPSHNDIIVPSSKVDCLEHCY
ncbi:unnamed protein product [Soboliphyme baturini]|uniref:Laminin N-terminal domain-containing protein n=1 Tax=Soboliphyme baturini TaxID=241478 RepID=A0A183IE50_9BILA|nr:unnamed protein product [Soboliphyme baturini]